MNNEEKILSMLETLSKMMTQMQIETNNRFDGISLRFDKVEMRLDRVETHLDSVEADIRTMLQQQINDSKRIQIIFDQTVKLTENQTKTDSELANIRAVL